jgi:hypothetical protein
VAREDTDTDTSRRGSRSISFGFPDYADVCGGATSAIADGLGKTFGGLGNAGRDIS